MADFNALIQNTIQSQVHRTDLDSLDVFNIWTRAGELIPPYWCKARDIELSRFWQRIDHVGSAFSMFVSKFASIPVKIVPRDMSVKAWMREADNLTANINGMSDYGQGWANSFIPRFVMDYITTDNGAFGQIIGDAPYSRDRVTGKRFKDYSKPREGFYGLTWLDSHFCQRTSSPVYPVIYTDPTSGERYRLHFSRVMYAASMSSPRTRLNGVGFCLHPDATVLTASGTYARVGDLVKSKSTELVMSIDENGKLVERPITNWYTNQLNGRKLINIRGTLSKLTQGKQERNSWVTNDHPILTPDGWKQAGDLQQGDLIMTGLPTPNQKQKEFLIGALMGDGSLVVKHGNAEQYRSKFSMGHSIDQKEWFDLKASVLCSDYGFSSRLYDAKLVYKGQEKIFPMYSGQTNSHAGFIELRQSFYQNGKKVLPLNLIEQNLSPLMLATWYLDDGNIIDRTKERQPRQRAYRGGGYYTVEITTTGFEPEQVDELVKILNNAGYEAFTINVNRGKPRKSIRLLKDGASRFFRDIAPYVPYSLRYKLPPGMPEFDSGLWNFGQADRLTDKVEIITERKKKTQTVYCIDVDETHNFITAGIVVHNCSLSRLINTAQHLWDISTAEQEELGSRPKRRLIIGEQGITAGEIRDAMAGADTIMDNQGLKRYSKSIVIAASTKPTSANAIKIAIQDLNAAMRGEDKEKSITLAVFLIALALNIPPRWLWPASSTGATKADAMYQHIAGMGGGVGYLIILLKNLLGGDMLAPALGKPIGPQYEVVFDFQDDEQDRQAAEIRKLRSEVWTANITSGIIDTRVAREQALAAGDLTEQQFDDLELADGRLPDGTDILNLFMTTDPELAAMLAISVGDVLNVEANEAEDVLSRIADKLIEVRAILVNPERPKTFDKAKQALAALTALQKLYTQPTAVEQQEGLAKIEGGRQEENTEGAAAVNSMNGRNDENTTEDETG